MAQTTPTTPERDATQPSSSTIGDYISAQFSRMRSGELGALPILLGLVLIAIIFQSQNQYFLSPRNFVNLMVQMAGITTIAIGVVFVLLLGEIDLSIGYVSAVSAALVAILLRSSLGLPWFVVVVAALLAAAMIGVLHGVIITWFQVPAFVVTLAGLLAWNGVVLLILRNGGTIAIQDPVVVGIANTYLPPLWGWLLALVVVGVFAGVQFALRVRRSRRELATTPVFVLGIQVALLAVVAFYAVYVSNQDRGFPLIGVIMLLLLTGFTFLATSTRFGRYVYAIGGNKEAARRAGIHVERIRVQVFMISSLMAGCGGIILASRLRSVDTAAGGGDLLLNSIAAAVIGGTSLFGGRGAVVNALLGALVIASVSNGMGLLSLSAGVKFVVTGLVLLAAVLVDAVSRRGQANSGR